MALLNHHLFIGCFLVGLDFVSIFYHYEVKSIEAEILQVDCLPGFNYMGGMKYKIVLNLTCPVTDRMVKMHLHLVVVVVVGQHLHA